MKIELNTRTKYIKEIPTKKELEQYEEHKDEIDGSIISIMCAALAAKIHNVFGTEDKDNKASDMCYKLIRNYIHSFYDSDS